MIFDMNTSNRDTNKVEDFATGNISLGEWSELCHSKWEEFLPLVPRRCYVTGKRLWLTRCYRNQFEWYVNECDWLILQLSKVHDPAPFPPMRKILG